MKISSNLFAGAIQLFYPHNCQGCGSDLLSAAEQLCLTCLADLPYTRYENIPGNPVEKIFYGRFPLVAAHSEFYFSKGQLLQFLLHQLKYKNNRAIGHYLGKIMGHSLLECSRFSQLDYLLPLAMSAKKERKRGYNQATIICNGISEVMQVPVLPGIVKRTRLTETQTKKHRDERWDNVYESFQVADIVKLTGKRILLVDDVLTTGATIEACCQALSIVPSLQVSVATLAFASK